MPRKIDFAPHFERFRLAFADWREDGIDVVPTLQALSGLVEAGDASEKTHPDEFAELRRAYAQSLHRIINFEWVLNSIRSVRKGYPRDHWWWYPEEFEKGLGQA
ncbi:MAG: hypothetical protein P9M14_07625 [Candidatus Alcyoniella australis]|nr:hypothetical protein [Candidatus Alcyoniella australis]